MKREKKSEANWTEQVVPGRNPPPPPPMPKGPVIVHAGEGKTRKEARV